MPLGEFKHRYCFFADAPNIARNCSVTWKFYDGEPILTVFSNIGEDVQYRCLKLSVWCEKCAGADHYADIGKQLLFANDRNRVGWVVLGLSHDGASTDLFENYSEHSLLGDLSNDTTVNPPLFSLVNTFNT